MVKPAVLTASDVQFLIRFSIFSTGFGIGSYVGYRAFLRYNDSLPIAQKWIPLSTEIRLSDKELLSERDKVYKLRFLLPGSYDSTGLSPVSSVQIYGSAHPFYGEARWFTPITHPDRRGTVEFIVSTKRVGLMANIFRNISPGDKLKLGRWVKEFDVHTLGSGGPRLLPKRGSQSEPSSTNTGPRDNGTASAVESEEKKKKSVTFIAGGTGVTPLIQLMNYYYPHGRPRCKDDPLRINMLVVGKDMQQVYGSTVFETAQRNNPEFVKVNYLFRDVTDKDEVATHERRLQEMGGNGKTSGRVFTGPMCPEVLAAAVPSPQETEKVLVCGGNELVIPLCSKPFIIPIISRFTYFQGVKSGFLTQAGFSTRQIYKFGTTEWYRDLSLAI